MMTSPLWEKYRLNAVKHGLRSCWATPILSSNGLVVDRGFVNADERAALLAYLRKL